MLSLFRFIEAFYPQTLVTRDMRDHGVFGLELHKALSVGALSVQNLDLLLGPLASHHFKRHAVALALQVAVSLVARMDVVQVEA